jgi:hypothetical protein
MSRCGCGSRYTAEDFAFDYTSKRQRKRARQKKNKQAANPDPSKFEILEVYAYDGWAALRVKYEGVTNYEGNKILVVKATLDDLAKMKKLDPHFCEGDHVKPFARFEPTERGWNEAKNLLISLVEGDEVAAYNKPL